MRSGGVLALGLGMERRAVPAGANAWRVLRRLACLLFFVHAAVAAAVPSYDEVRGRYQASDIVLLDRSGQPLQRTRSNYQERRGDWLALSDISPALQEAVLQSEDHRFYAHAGIDWRAVAAAAWDYLVARGHRGASTLTMQLTGLVDVQRRRGPQGRSLSQKLDQMVLAREIERGWTKSQILEAYLNLVAFRGEIVGVDALSRVLFQKHASGLDGRESALAAVMLRGPNVSEKVLVRRACLLLRKMGQSGECSDLRAFVHASLRRLSAMRADAEGLAPHFAQWFVEQRHPQPGERVVTSIDANLQRFVIQSLRRHLLALRSGNVSDAAVVVLDNATGEILAYVGSSGDLSRSAWVDHAQALRQAGSTLKPFLYAQAIEQERLTAVSLLHDSPLGLPTGNGLYVPQNYDRHFSGWVSVRTALASSLNIPAVRTLVLVTPDAFQRRLVQLGLPLNRMGDFYGYSLALGSADVSLLTLSNAYRALANLGNYGPTRLAPGVGGLAPFTRVMSPAAAWIVGDVLSDRHARARTFGLDSPLATAFWTAVKTGTSKDMRDNWCVGWSERYTVGVWVGNSSGASMRGVSGVSGAGPAWHDIMDYLHRKTESQQPPAPMGVVHQFVVFDGGLEPARDDYFVGDTAVSVVRRRHDTPGEETVLRLVAPVDGTVVALDPDIPPANQKLLLHAKGGAESSVNRAVWKIDGESVGVGEQLMWAPRPGKHNVELLDADGRTHGRATITVRGAAQKGATSLLPRG